MEELAPADLQPSDQVKRYRSSPDLPTIFGAAPRGSLAALALEILLRFGAADPAPLVERFFAGWVPAGLDENRLEDLRLWWTHGILWWAGLSLSLGADFDADLTGVYAAAWHSLKNDDPVSWLLRDAAAAMVLVRLNSVHQVPA